MPLTVFPLADGTGVVHDVFVMGTHKRLSHPQSKSGLILPFEHCFEPSLFIVSSVQIFKTADCGLFIIILWLRGK